MMTENNKNKTERHSNRLHSKMVEPIVYSYYYYYFSSSSYFGMILSIWSYNNNLLIWYGAQKSFRLSMISNYVRFMSKYLFLIEIVHWMERKRLRKWLINSSAIMFIDRDDFKLTRRHFLSTLFSRFHFISFFYFYWALHSTVCWWRLCLCAHKIESNALKILKIYEIFCSLNVKQCLQMKHFLFVASNLSLKSIYALYESESSNVAWCQFHIFTFIMCSIRLFIGIFTENSILLWWNLD